MEKELATLLKQNLERLKTKREDYDPIWQELALLCDPRNAYFNVKRSSGDTKFQLLPKCDDTFQANLPLYANILTNTICPQSYKWHLLKFKDQRIQREYGPWLSTQNDIIYNMRYSTGSGFLTSVAECFMSGGVYGHCLLQVTKDRATKSLKYQALPVKEFYIDKNAMGIVDTIYRVVEFSLRNLRQLFPDYIPAQLQNSFQNPQKSNEILNTKIELLVAVEPSDMKRGKTKITYMNLTHCEIIELRPESSSQIICAREMVFPTSDDPYGFSRAMSVLPSIRALNSLQFNVIKLWDEIGKSVYLTGEDIINPQLALMNGGIIPGGLDEQGRSMIQKMPTSSGAYQIEQEIQKFQKTIQDSLFTSLYLINQNTQSRSATDAAIKSNERTTLIAPIADRYAREMFAPLIEIEQQLLDEMGLLPDVPQELLDEAANGVDIDYDVVFDSPIMKMLRQDSLQGIIQLQGMVAQNQPNNPEIADLVNSDEAVREVADLLNVPQRIINSPIKVQEIRDARNKANEAQQIAASIPEMASAAKDLSVAAKNTGNI